MFEWIQTLPEWVQWVWGFYVTFHDLVQWAVIGVLGYTAWGKKKHRAEIEEIAEEVAHIHEELHIHIDEDSSFHEKLDQTGMTRGK